MSEISVGEMLEHFEGEVKDPEIEEDPESEEIEFDQVNLPRKQQAAIELCRNCGDTVRKTWTRCPECGIQTRDG